MDLNNSCNDKIKIYEDKLQEFKNQNVNGEAKANDMAKRIREE